MLKFELLLAPRYWSKGPEFNNLEYTMWENLRINLANWNVFLEKKIFKQFKITFYVKLYTALWVQVLVRRSWFDKFRISTIKTSFDVNISIADALVLDKYILKTHTLFSLFRNYLPFKKPFMLTI